MTNPDKLQQMENDSLLYLEVFLLNNWVIIIAQICFEDNGAALVQFNFFILEIHFTLITSISSKGFLHTKVQGYWRFFSVKQKQVTETDQNPW